MAGGMKKGLHSLEAQKQDEMMFMELALRVRMRHEFDKEFGEVHFSMSYRDKVIVMSFPLSNDDVCLVLGDNIFYGTGLAELLQSNNDPDGGIVYAYHVNDPQRYGVVEFDYQHRVLSIEEKPRRPKSNYAVTGLYFYDERASEFARGLKPSVRGELEITDLNRCYLDDDSLAVERLGRGYAWLDTGTHESLQQASSFIETIESRQGLKVACPEEIAFMQGWIDEAQVRRLAQPLRKSGYGEYLLSLLTRGRQ